MVILKDSKDPLQPFMVFLSVDETEQFIFQLMAMAFTGLSKSRQLYIRDSLQEKYGNITNDVIVNLLNSLTKFMNSGEELEKAVKEWSLNWHSTLFTERWRNQ